MEKTTITITIQKKKVMYYYRVEFKKSDFNKVMEVVPTLKEFAQVFEIEKTGLWTVKA